jgi:DNA-binding transcriptional ArsR family regulator
MGVTKTALFTAEQNEFAILAKALAHPARVAILMHLAKTNQCITGNLVDLLGLAQPTISQHLKELKNIGLIKGTVEGTAVCYCIDPDRWKHLKTLFLDMFAQFNPEERCC